MEKLKSNQQYHFYFILVMIIAIILIVVILFFSWSSFLKKIKVENQNPVSSGKKSLLMTLSEQNQKNDDIKEYISKVNNNDLIDDKLRYDMALIYMDVQQDLLQTEIDHKGLIKTADDKYVFNLEKDDKVLSFHNINFDAFLLSNDHNSQLFLVLPILDDLKESDESLSLDDFFQKGVTIQYIYDLSPEVITKYLKQRRFDDYKLDDLYLKNKDNKVYFRQIDNSFEYLVFLKDSVWHINTLNDEKKLTKENIKKIIKTIKKNNN